MYLAIVALLCLFPVGRSAPLTSSSCEDLLKPIEISNEEVLGKWLYIGYTSDIPGTRSLSHLMTSAWVDVTPATQKNVLNIVQTQRVLGVCSSINYSAPFENSMLLMEEPVYMKEVYYPVHSECPDCLSFTEVIIHGADTWNSVFLFSKSKRSLSPATVEMFKKQVECFKMPAPIMMAPNYEICPEPTSFTQGVDGLVSLLEAKMAHQIVRLADRFFDMFVN